MILSIANGYNKKYYLNDKFSILPKQIKDEIQIMLVSFTERLGGILSLEYDDNGELMFKTSRLEEDIFYDEIEVRLSIDKLSKDNYELLNNLELFYKTFNI